MHATAVTLIDVALENASDEEAFLDWWAEAEALLRERAKLIEARVAVLARGRYAVALDFALPGGFKLVAADRPWLELAARRPKGSFETRDARRWRRPGDLTTTEVARWLEERRRGARDFVLVDALRPDRFAERHLPGAVNLPADTVTAETAAAAIGATDRAVVVYCASYG